METTTATKGNEMIVKTTGTTTTTISLDLALSFLGYNVRGLTRDLVAARLIRGETLRTATSSFRVA